MDKRLVPIAFAGGVDTKTHPAHVLPSKLLALQNGIFKQTGAIAKRWGYKKLGQGILGSSATIASCAAINAFSQELLLYDGQNAYSYSPARDAWASRGQVVSVIQSNQEIIRNTAQQLSPDFGSLNGIDVYAWEDSRGGIRYSVLDSASGSYVLVDQPLFSGMASTIKRPKVIPFPAAGVVVVLFVSVLGQLAYVSINPANPTAVASSAVVLVGGLATPAFYDAALSGLGDKLFLAYYTAAPAVSVSAIDSSLQVTVWTTAPISVGASLPVGCLNVSSDASGNAYLTYADNAAGSLSCSVAIYSTAGATVLGATQVIVQATGPLQSVASIFSTSAGLLFVYAEAQGSQTYNQVLYANSLTTGGVLSVPAASPIALKRSVGLASKPFQYLGTAYLHVAFQSPLQPTYFTLDQSGREVGKVNPGLGGGLVANSDYMLPECQQIAPGIFRYANLVKGGPTTVGGQVVALLGVNATKEDFIDTNHFLSTAINGGYYTVGGILQSYDGTQYVEHGFHVYPEGITSATSGAGGSLGTGTYNYVVTYEWLDNNGLTQISTPSVAIPITFGSGTTNKVTLTIPTLRLTKKTNVIVHVYRTVASGTLLYRVTSALVPLYSDPTVDTVQVIDTLADASITSNALLYTQPLSAGASNTNPILPNSAPPSCSLITSYDDRLFIGGLDTPNQIAYTKATTANVPMEFAATLTLTVDPEGGPVTALARMDDKLIVFKRAAIFYLIGQGPTATGDASNYGNFIAVPSGGVGCVSQNSVVLTPVGLMFDSGNGIYLLDRGLSVSYKGAPVEAFNGTAIASATLIPNQWVVFTTATGTALVYDFFYDQWSTFTNHAAVDSDLYVGGGNLFAFAAAGGQVYLQTPTLYTDAGRAIPLSLTTSWVNPGVLQGYQRVYHAFVLGTYKGSHTLDVWAGFDYQDALTALAPIPVDSTLSMGTFGSSTPFGQDPLFGSSSSDPSAQVYQFRVDVLRKCQAIQFQISETDAGVEALSLAALSLVVGVKRGGNKVPAAKQFGAL
jgi:hypothetical protein